MDKFDKTKICLTNEKYVIDYVNTLLIRVDSEIINSTSNIQLLVNKLSNWVKGEKDDLVLNNDESGIFEMLSVNAFLKGAKSISFFKLLFMPKKTKIEPSEIVFFNIYGATYLKFNDNEVKEILKIDSSGISYELTVYGNFLDIKNEKDPDDIMSKGHFYLPFIQKIWINQFQTSLFTTTKQLRIIHNKKVEDLIDISSMSKEQVNSIINFLLIYNPAIIVEK